MFTEPAEVRRVIMECDALSPLEALTATPEEWVTAAWNQRTYLEFGSYLYSNDNGTIHYSGLLWRLTRTWSLADQASLFATCRPFTVDSIGASGDFMHASVSTNHYSVLARGWGEPATALLERTGSTQARVTLLKHILSELQLTTCTVPTLGRVLC